LFFNVIDKPPAEVTTQDVFDFIAVQRRPRGDGKVIRLVDGEAGLSARTVKRRRSSVSGRSEEHTSELQSPRKLVCRLLLEKQKSPPGPRTGSPTTPRASCRRSSPQPKLC